MLSALSTLTRKHHWLAWTLPFIVFILLTELANLLPAAAAWLYLLKTVSAALLLWFFRHQWRSEVLTALTPGEWLAAIGCGLLVLVVWVGGESLLYQRGEPTPLEITAFGSSQAAIAFLVGFRLLGSSLVVPLMEELFWRSFIMRWLIGQRFLTVPIGSFTAVSFIATAICFGLEHNRIVAGIIAGLVYGGIVVVTKKLTPAILAHMVTNFGLGLYIIITGSWFFW